MVSPFLYGIIGFFISPEYNTLKSVPYRELTIRWFPSEETKPIIAGQKHTLNL